MKFLIFDTILNGHHTDYITYLVDYWWEHQLPGELWVVTPRGFSATLSAEAKKYPGIHCLELNDDELQSAQKGTTLRRSFSEWNLFVKYARQVRPTQALLMYFDLFQMGMWLGEKPPCPVSGIYFRPSFHYPAQLSVKEKAVALRKKWLLGRVLSNPSLSHLFCLDKSSVKTIRKMSNRVRVLPLSDPVRKYAISTHEVEALRETLDIDPHRKVFLVFGYLDNRKGIEPVLDAIDQLTPTERANFTLILAGPISDEYRHLIDDRINSLKSGTQVVCLYEKRLGPAIQMLFDLSDFVLTLYQKHIGMSSIVVRAALARKPLISSDFGYMGSLVDTEALGTTVNSESIPSIVEAFRQALRGEISFSGPAVRALSEQNTAQQFARQIIGALVEAPVTPL
jgi:glycosyltransferase involved in cell wall biosynthesis